MIVKDAIPRIEAYQFRHAINWEIKSGQQWAIVGANGSGKSTLINVLTGKYALKSGEVKLSEYSLDNRNGLIRSVSFTDIYSLTDTRNAFYQQRWNAGLMDTNKLVADLFSRISDPDWLSYLVTAFGVEPLLAKDIRLLSSGELRKILILKSLLDNPRVLIVENPYIGLDSASRVVINELFDDLLQSGRLQLILAVSDPDDIPPFITHVLPVCDKALGNAILRTDFLLNDQLRQQLFPGTDGKIFDFPDYSLSGKRDAYQTVLNMRQVKIQYGSHTVLNELNWEVRKGEKWSLLGKNGSGKSTLFSLVTGDNPQAYANPIELFDQRRGAGESIWDIKRRIGYVSPEMHLYYLENNPCLAVVASGFFDTIGLYRKHSAEQEAQSLAWMRILGIERLADTSFLSVSTGEQRLVLLARAFVKNPDLLILDEPLHGLDITNKKRVKRIIEQFCDDTKTLIYVSHYKEEIPDIVNKTLYLS